MGNPFKINGGAIQKTRGILSKSTGTAKVLQFQTFHRSAAKHPPNGDSQPHALPQASRVPAAQAEHSNQDPFAPRRNAYVEAPEGQEVRIGGTLVRYRPGGARGPRCRKEMFRVGPPLRSCHNRLADCPHSNFESSNFESSNFERAGGGTAHPRPNIERSKFELSKFRKFNI